MPVPAPHLVPPGQLPQGLGSAFGRRPVTAYLRCSGTVMSPRVFFGATSIVTVVVLVCVIVTENVPDSLTRPVSLRRPPELVALRLLAPGPVSLGGVSVSQLRSALISLSATALMSFAMLIPSVLRHQFPCHSRRRSATFSAVGAIVPAPTA